MTQELDERRRLTDLYSAMSDQELLALGAEMSQLSDIAQEVLRAELGRRKLETPTPPPTPEEHEYLQLVTVREFRDLPEADLAKSILDSAGIQSFLQDENMIRMNWFNSNFFGGIKLRVLSEDQEEARGILTQAIPSNFEVEGVGDYVQPRCPKCNSLEVIFTGFNKPVAYASMWAGLPLRVPSSIWKCEQCGNEWTEILDEKSVAEES
jgi:hypothetical protein